MKSNNMTTLDKELDSAFELAGKLRQLSYMLIDAKEYGNRKDYDYRAYEWRKREIHNLGLPKDLCSQAIDDLVKALKV